MGCPSVFGGSSSSGAYKPIKGAEGAGARPSKCVCVYVYKNAETGAPSAPSPVGSALSWANPQYERGQLARPPPAPKSRENR